MDIAPLIKLHKEIQDDGLNFYFKSPNSTNGIYIDISKDLDEIYYNLEKGCFHSPSEWAESVKSYYELVLSKCEDDTVEKQVCEHLLKKIVKKTKILRNNPCEWMNQLIKKSNDVINHMKSRPKTPIGLIDRLRKISYDDNTQMTPKIIKEIVMALNEKLENPKMREELLQMLNVLEQIPIEEASKKPIDLEKLSPETQKIMKQYALL